MDYINLSDLSGKIPELETFNLPPISPPSFNYEIPHVETIDPEDNSQSCQRNKDADISTRDSFDGHVWAGKDERYRCYT